MVYEYGGIYKSLTTSKSEDQVEGRFLLDVVVRKGSAVFELFSGEDESLLIWGDSFFVLDFALDSFNAVRWFDIESNGFASQGLDEDLHTSSEPEDQVEGRFLLDVVVRKGSAVFELFSGEDESLLIWGDSFLVLDFALDSFNAVRWFDIESNSFSCQGLDEDLHLK